MSIYIENPDGTVQVLVEDYSSGDFANLTGDGVTTLPSLGNDSLALKSEVTGLKTSLDALIADLDSVMVLNQPTI